MFAQKFVINLTIRPDRLRRFYNNFKHIPGFGPEDIQAVTAIHGDTCKHPKWWTAGNGAWGCYKSHLNLLEQCYNNRLESYLVLEDDAIPHSLFQERYAALQKNLPDDWEMLYLGGQILHEFDSPSTKVAEGIMIPYNVNRTHAFAVHQRGYEKLYHHLNDTPFEFKFHIDHHLGRLHERKGIKVYVPSKWLIGQSVGSSNITGKYHPEDTFWPDPEFTATDHWLFKRPVVIYLMASQEVAEALTKKGWHRGNWLTSEGVDHGINSALSCAHPMPLIEKWYNTIRIETIRDQKLYPCLYCPSMKIETVRAINFAHVVYIQATTVEEAEAQAKANPLLNCWRANYEK